MTAQEHPADVLRRAAALIRERAQAASKGPWKSYVEGRDHFGGDSIISTADTAEDAGDIYVNVDRSDHGKWEADQDYIASWHPLVAEAVAALLEREAALIDARAFPQSDPAAERYPLAVALAYLGEAGTGGTGS